MKNTKHIATLLGLILLFSCNKYDGLGKTNSLIFFEKEHFNIKANNKELIHSEILLDSYALDKNFQKMKTEVESKHKAVKDFSTTSATLTSLELKEKTYFFTNNKFDATEYIEYFEVFLISPSTGFKTVIHKTTDIARYEADEFEPEYKTWRIPVENNDFKSFHAIANDIQMELRIHFKKECPFQTNFSISGGLNAQYNYKYKN